MAIRAESDAQDAKRDWFTAAELADLDLPGLAGDKRAVQRRAKEERWNERCDMSGHALARDRKGRGGVATEYHVSLLPEASRSELALRSSAANDDAAKAENVWAWYESQTAKVKAEAEKRHAIVLAAEALQAEGRTKGVIADELARRYDLSPATIWNYFKLIRGVPRGDWRPALAPRRKGGGAEADIDADLYLMFKSDVLRPEKPPMALCYEHVETLAKARGLTVPSLRTFTRRLKADVDPRIARLLREGKEADRRSRPAQRRTVDHLHALECVNIDGHTFDVRVYSREAKDKDGKPKVVRPILLGIQDVRSSKVLAWRVCEAESAHYVRLVFGDLFEKWGIPVHCVLDNGRGFASKWITGGVKNRFRFKVKDEDPVGLISGLGIQHHWALPYHGQSKPIERAWSDLTNRIAKSAFTSGAYTGRSPMHKPANYGERAVEWDAFVVHVNECIAKHNAKLGRRGRDYRGRSFDEVFTASYVAAPIGKATPEQLRMALLAGEQKMVNRQTGEIQLFGNRYYSEACSRLHGQRVTVRFDPDDLTKDIHLYDLEGRYIASAQLWQDAEFLSTESAKKSAKFEADARRKIREGVEAEELLTAAQIAAMQSGAPIEEAPTPKVTRMVRHRGQTAAALKIDAQPVIEANERQSRIFAALRVVEN